MYQTILNDSIFKIPVLSSIGMSTESVREFMDVVQQRKKENGGTCGTEPMALKRHPLLTYLLKIILQ